MGLSGVRAGIDSDVAIHKLIVKEIIFEETTKCLLDLSVEIQYISSVKLFWHENSKIFWMMFSRLRD